MAADSSTVQRTLSLLEEGDKKIKLSNKHKDIVLILGNTGSGKTTFTQFIAGNNNKLRSKEIGEDTGEFLIVDEEKKISANSTILPQTIFPDLVVHEVTHTAFYDCPGFSDTRNTANDIASAYFVHTVIKHAESVKLLFVVNYHSVKEGVDRRDFLTLLKHVINFIPDIDNFKNSIALIVTKVDNRMVWKKGVPMLVPDSKEISNIARFLENAKTSIKFIMKDESIEKKRFYEDMIKLIDIFLIKDNENYSRVALFRRPNQSGLLSEIPLLQNEKYHIEKMIEKDLKFTVNNVKNYGFAISAESRNEIVDIVAIINKQITMNVLRIMRQIEDHFEKYSKQTTDMNRKRDTFNKSYDVLFSTVKVTKIPLTPTTFIKTILESIKSLDIDVSSKILEEVVTLDKHLNFLQMISSRDVKSRSLDWIRPLEETTKSLQDSKEWYNFLIDLYNRLSKFDIQQNKSRYKVGELQGKLRNLRQKNIKIIGDSLRDFVHQVYEKNVREKRLIPGYDNVKTIEIDEPKLKDLNEVLDVTLARGISVSCFNSDELIIHGNYIKMSDVLVYLAKNICSNKIQSLKIFAANKIFIDADLVQIGSKLLVIVLSPIWEIIGDRKIALDGASGMAHSRSKARDAFFVSRFTYNGDGVDGMDGDNGLPGATGGSAGSFFGIGDTFINENHLKITVNGGNGSNGQDGGDGANGASGRDASWDYSYPSDVIETLHTGFMPFLLYNKHDEYIMKLGRPGGKGGNGGNGGKGGYGGNEGEIQIYGLSKKPDVRTERIKGQRGKDGRGGDGGSGGLTGDYCTAKDQDHFVLFAYVGTNRVDKECGFSSWTRAEFGKDGLSGFHGTDVTLPEEAKKVQDPSYIVNDYKNYIRRYLKDDLSREVLNFYERLGNNYNVKKLYDTLGLINEFQGMEYQYYSLNGYLDFLPFYRSLMQRVEEYARSPKYGENSKTYKNVLGYLYAAILSKVCGMKENQHNDLVIHITQYLNLISQNIVQFRQLSKSLIIQKYNTNYKEMIDRKIMEATYFIDNYIKDQLNETNEEINKEITTLIDDITKQKMKMEEERQDLLKKKRQLMESRELHAVAQIMKVVGNVLMFLEPVVGLGVTAVNAAVMVGDTFGLGDGNVINMEPISNMLQQVIQETNESLTQINKEQERLAKQNDGSFMDTEMIDIKITHLDEKLNIIKEYEKKIFDLVLPMMKTIRNDLNNLQPKLKNMSQVSLQVTKWKVQSTLKDVKSHMRYIISQTEPRENITNLYDRLNEGTNLLINIYDRIQNYIDQKTFADYIANINLANSVSTVANGKLKNALDYLQLSIKSNLILDQYKKATKALTQFIFPFAEFYIADFRLPSSIKVNEDLVDITSNAIQQIKSLQMKLIESEVSIQKHDKYVQRAYFYSDNEYTAPFFIWHNDQYENDIKALLSGQEVLLKADIMKSGKKNAVKFNQIGISFKVHDDMLQNELDEKLKHFDVSMTHLGNSYYKCDDRYYIISNDIQTIRYSFARSNQSISFSRNLVYDKLMNSPSMLSPYAMWKIKLSVVTMANFTILEKFGNLTDLELVGRGQYVLPDADVCDRELSTYYQESDVSDMDNLYERLKWEKVKSTDASTVRSRRDIVDIDLNDFAFNDTNEENPPISSGANSNQEFGMHRIFRWFGENLSIFKSFNPIDYLSQWFVQGSNENLYFNSNQISGMTNDSTEPYMFTSPTFDVNSSLVLADFFIRRYVTGEKYHTSISTQNLRNTYCNYDREYAHSLAYNYYCPIKQNKNVEPSFTTVSKCNEDSSINDVFPTSSYINVSNTDYLKLVGDGQESAGFLI